MQNKAPERIWLQKYPDEPVINPTWTAEPCTIDRGEDQYEYIRADLVEKMKEEKLELAAQVEYWKQKAKEKRDAE